MVSDARWLVQVLRFIDIGGHEKYLKTALYGMTSLLPDYVLLCVNTHAHGHSLPRASREHLAVALALEIPLAVVLTQVTVTHACMHAIRPMQCRLICRTLCG